MPPAQPPEILRLQKELDAAIKAHQAGRIDEAEAVYIKVLERVPTRMTPQSLLGSLAAA
jgi:hypothetical protein